MKRRQTVPSRWLVADERLGEQLWRAVRKLPRGSGVLFLYGSLSRRERHQLLRRLRQPGRAKALTIAEEQDRCAARVHNIGELRSALLARTPLILLSPIHPTSSHPDWRPLPRMRAAALARLGHRRLVALGGMNERRFRRVQRLGFIGWAGIDEFRT